MLRHCATLSLYALAALSGCTGAAWGQDIALRDSFVEVLSAEAAEERYSPQGGLDRNAGTAMPPLASPQPAPPPRPAEDPALTASIETTHGPTGIGIGGFDLFPALEIRGGFQEVAGQGSGYGALLGTLAATGGIGLFDIGLDLAADVERDGDGLGEIAFESVLDAEAAINRHLGVRADLHAERNPQDGLNFNDDSTLSSLPDETVYGAGLELLLKGNRASLTPRLRAARHHFSGAASADDLNYLETEAGLRAAYEFSPLLGVFTDGEYARSEFDESRGVDGILRGSERGGVALGAVYTPGDWLTAEVALGAERAEFEDGSALSGLRAEGALTYRASALTDLTLRGRHGIADDIVGSGGVRETRASLSLVHRFRTYLQLEADLAYLREDAGAGGDAARIDAQAEIAYALRRGVYLTAGGEISRLIEGANADDTDWQVYMGVKLAR